MARCHELCPLLDPALLPRSRCSTSSLLAPYQRTRPGFQSKEASRTRAWWAQQYPVPCTSTMRARVLRVPVLVLAISSLSAALSVPSLECHFPSLDCLKLRPPAPATSPRTHIAKAAQPEKEAFSLRAVFQTLPQAWRDPAINGWASLLAGIVAYTIATPMEAFKVGIQTWPGSTLLGIGRNVLKTRGPLGFFNGIDAMLWAGIPYCVVMYGSYQPVKRGVEEKLRQAGCEAGAWGQVLGGSLAETLGLIVFIPGELVRMRMMNDPAHMLKRNLVVQISTEKTLGH